MIFLSSLTISDLSRNKNWCLKLISDVKKIIFLTFPKIEIFSANPSKMMTLRLQILNFLCWFHLFFIYLNMNRRAYKLYRVIRRPGWASLNFHKKWTFEDFRGQFLQVCDILNIQIGCNIFLSLVYSILIWIHSRRAPDDWFFIEFGRDQSST